MQIAAALLALLGTLTACALAGAMAAHAQVPPTAEEAKAYSGLHAAAATGDHAALRSLLARGADPNTRDSHGRTPLHVAAFRSDGEALRILVAAGGDIGALESDRYDVVTIAAVADDVPTLDVALSLGASARLVTSRYDGTALIAAAHLGHAHVVRRLIAAGAPLDHVNNLGWTALIEAVVLGDGGPRHVATARALVEAGANRTIADRSGVTPLQHAERRGYRAMVDLLK